MPLYRRRGHPPHHLPGHGVRLLFVFVIGWAKLQFRLDGEALGQQPPRGPVADRSLQSQYIGAGKRTEVILGALKQQM
jgi:hypothetical protein